MCDARVLLHLRELWSDAALVGQIMMTISGCDVGPLIGDLAYPKQRWLMKPGSTLADLHQKDPITITGLTVHDQLSRCILAFTILNTM